MGKIFFFNIFKIILTYFFVSSVGLQAYSQTQPASLPDLTAVNGTTQEKQTGQSKNSVTNSNLDPGSAQDEIQPEEEGLLGPVRIGPMVGFGVLLGPNVSVEAKIFKYFGLSFTYSQYNDVNVFNIYDFKTSINNSNDYNVDSLHMNYKQIEGKISYFPWGETFFIGTAVGKRDITLNAGGQVNASIPQIPQTISAPVRMEYVLSSLYVTPQIGWLASWDGPYGGFAIGTELGAQITLSNSITLTPTVSGVDPSYVSEIENSAQYLEMKKQIEDHTGEKIKSYPLPYWNIIKIGWLF